MVDCVWDGRRFRVARLRHTCAPCLPVAQPVKRWYEQVPDASRLIRPRWRLGRLEGRRGRVPRAHSGSRGGDSQATSLTLDLAPDVFTMRVLLEETGEMFRVTNCRADTTVLELKKELDLATSLTLDLAPDVFTMRVLLEETGEMFRVTNCRADTTVLELKKELDLVAGIPLNLQRLHYLDQGILMDDTTLKFHDVVPGGIISLCVWHYDGWMELVLAAVEGDPSKLFCLGVTEESFYRTANSQHLEEKQRKRWVSQRAAVALYVTSHRGHAEAVQYLLENGANCLSRTPMGRTPLHVAAAMGRLDCINLLLRHGAAISAKDAMGMTPMAIFF
ncbi:ankyrin repeat domain-containing protein 60 [Pteropus alecto]|uniref:ankyrin repeat domain-containing protein 60 n=1 Tax=Pteropus alecto TaxID=9402 RepID=UPI00076862CB|nr:ankyrin repeat domain-containing protein 60 [Pteropus alecto]